MEEIVILGKVRIAKSFLNGYIGNMPDSKSGYMCSSMVTKNLLIIRRQI